MQSLLEPSPPLRVILDSERSKNTIPNVQCPPRRVCVCLLGKVWTMKTYTLDCKTLVQNHLCKARSIACYFLIFSRQARWPLSSLTLRFHPYSDFPLTARARVLDLGKKYQLFCSLLGHLLEEKSEKASTATLNFA